MRNILYFFFCFIAAEGLSNNIDTTHLSGRITNQETHEGLANASIFFPDLKAGTVSDKNGYYHLANLPKIKTLVQVTMIGYALSTEIIDLSQTQQLDFTLELSALELKEITITGSSNAIKFKENPIPTIALNSKDLKENSSTNIIDALNKIPGVSALSTGPNVSKPYIRGLGYNRALTLFDGVRQDGQQWGDEHGIEVDQFLIDRIEVVKGPASLMYGSDALAGVVNLIPLNPAPIHILKGSLSNNYQSNNQLIANSFALQGNQKGIAWGFRMSHKQAMNYQNKLDGRVYGTKFNESDLNANIGLYKSRGYSFLNFSLYDNNQEIPDGSRDSTTNKFTHQISENDVFRPIVSKGTLNSYNIADVRQRVQHYRIYSSSNFIIGKSKLALKFGAQQSVRREFGNPEKPSEAGLHLVLNSFSYDVKYYLPEIKMWENTIGINGLYQENKNTNATEYLIPNYSSIDFGPFIHTKKSFGKLNVSGGLRYDLRIFNNEATANIFSPYQHTFAGMSASAGATYNMNKKWCFKANIARGYRAPNIAEISAKGVHPGTGFQQLGDENFKPEFSLQEDLGVFFNSEHISFSLESFHNVISNYIYNEKLNSVNGGDSLFVENGNFYPIYKFKQTTALLYGGEFNIDIHPHPIHWLHFENSASFINTLNLGANTDSTKYLPFIPPFHSNSELRAEIKSKSKYFSELFVKIGFQYFATQNQFYGAYGTETATPSYSLIDAAIGGNILNKKGNTICNFNINGSNLSDQVYQSNMSRLKYMGIYNMGRNISVKLIFPLSSTLK